MSSKVIIRIQITVVIIVIVIGAGLGYQIYQIRSVLKEKARFGTIEGSLSYPSEFIPSDMKVCAENVETKKLYCTEKHIKNSKYTYGEGYKVEVPVGSYHVYAITGILKGYKAYYSEFVTCGFDTNCLSHEPIVVIVESEQIISGIDPQDWY